jgi:hypothetical protein
MAQWFYSEVHVLANTLVPIVSTAHLVVRRLISITRQAHTLGTTRTYPQVMVAQWHTPLELLFVTPTGWAQSPSQSLLRSTAQSSLRASTETTTKPFRRCQPPRVTNTTCLQLDRLVPPDVISQCNALELLTRNGFALLASTSELEASQTKHTQGQHILKVLNLDQARTPPLFIASKLNRVVGGKYSFSARAPDRAMPLQWSSPNG